MSENRLLHELLNQITIVNGECDLMSDKACRDTNRRLTAIMRATKQMAQMIDEYRCQQHDVISIAQNSPDLRSQTCR